MRWFVILCLLCLVVAVMLLGLWWRARHRRWLRNLELGVGLILASVGLLPFLWLVMSLSGDDSPRSLQLSDRIRYERFVADDAVVHWATVDLAGGSPCLDVVLSRPDAEGIIAADTGTGFVSSTAATIAVNVAFFHPIREYPHWASYPEVGDPITALGHVVDHGEALGKPSAWDRYLMIDPSMGKSWIGPLSTDGIKPLAATISAIAGREQVVLDSEVVAAESGLYPRTVVGVDHDADRLHLMVVDGKQWGYSRGMTLADVAALLVERGVDDALELDGGGSSTMAATLGGEPTLLSRPSHTRIPGRERPVATFLGLVDGCD